MFRIELIGNLGKDCRIINANGASFLSFTVAASNYGKDIEGNKIVNTTWVSCSAAPSESMAKYLVKGAAVFIRGKARLSVYKGINNYSVDVSCKCDELQILSTPSNNNDNGNNIDGESYQGF